MAGIFMAGREGMVVSSAGMAGMAGSAGTWLAQYTRQGAHAVLSASMHRRCSGWPATAAVPGPPMPDPPFRPQDTCMVPGLVAPVPVG